MTQKYYLTYLIAASTLAVRMVRWSSSDNDDDNGGKSSLESKSNSGSRCEPGRTTSPFLLGALSLVGERLTIGVSIGASSEPDEIQLDDLRLLPDEAWLDELDVELILYGIV